jgi:hypothetical protein
MGELNSRSLAVHYGASMTRRMADAAFLSSQQEGTHSEPHMAPINAFVDKIRDKDGRGWVPYIAPHHGGTDAQILSILRDPGPAAHSDKGSGFLSVENDDPTAERQARLFEAHGISPRIVLPWNAYPWYINAAPDAKQSAAGAEVLVELLRLLPRLRLVLLQGRDAERSWARVLRIKPDIAENDRLRVVATIHPSRSALFHPDPDERARRVAHQEETYRGIAAILATQAAVDSNARERA